MGFLKILLIFIFCSFPWPSIQSDLETYIVHVESPESLISTQSSLMVLESYYLSFLPKSTTGISSSGNEEPASLIYSYHNVMKGFAARLTTLQLKEMKKKPGFVSAQPQEILSLQTTHTPSFLGLQQNMGLWKDSNYGKGVIIGIIDSGILPDHPSFSDVGMPPPPTKWKGVCEPNFTDKCNNKLIGARSFPQLVNGSPIDDIGHGTHTARKAAGAFVKSANVYGNASGTAVGVAPLAHIAIYKVCNTDGDCPDSDILAVMDEAIDDGVDILSISLGGDLRPFHNDSRYQHDSNLRTNSLQDGDDDMGIPSSILFTRSQARELQRLQALFTSLAMCEALVSPSKGLYLIKCEEAHQDIPNPPT